MALAPTATAPNQIPEDELYILYKGINENKHLSRQYFTGRHADIIVQNQILANATDDLDLSTGQLVAASIDAFSQNLADRHTTRYHTPDDPQHDQVKLENAVAIESIAKLHYIQSPLMNDFIESAPLPVGLKPSEENALNDAFDKLSVGAKQLAGADMKASLEITSDLDFNDTIGVIQHALKEHGELMSHFKRPETDDLFRYDLPPPKPSLAVFNDTLREHVNNNPELITDRLPAVATKEEQTMAETSSAPSNETLVDPLGLDDPMTEQAEAAREAAIDHQAVEISEQVARNEQTQQQQPSPAPMPPMDDAMSGYDDVGGYENEPAYMGMSQQDNGLSHDTPPPFDDVPDNLYEQDANQVFPNELNTEQQATPKAKVVYIQGQDVEKADADLNFLMKSIEDNPFYGSGKIDVGAIEKSLQDANTKLNDAKPSPALRIAALHRNLELQTAQIARDGNTPDHDAFDKFTGIFHQSAAALKEVTTNQLNSTEATKDYIDPAKPPFDYLIPRQLQALNDPLKTIPESARQYALSQTQSAIEKNGNLELGDVINTVRQALYELDEAYKQVDPEDSLIGEAFERSLTGTIDYLNKDAVGATYIKTPKFTPQPTDNITIKPVADAANTEGAKNEGAKNEGAKNTDGAKADQEEKPESDEEIDDPDNARDLQQLPVKQGGFTLFNFSSNYAETPSQPKPAPAANPEQEAPAATTTPTETPAANSEQEAPAATTTPAETPAANSEQEAPAATTTPAANSGQEAPAATTTPAANSGQEAPAATAAPVEAPKPKPFFNDAMAQQDYEALNAFHEKLMSRYKDSDASDSYLHNETEAWLERTEELAMQADIILSKQQQDQEQLDNMFKGLENVSKLKEELKEAADKKGFLDPEHSLNKDKGKDADGKDKKGLGEKFDDVTNGLNHVMKGVGNFLAGIKNAFTNKGNKP